MLSKRLQALADMVDTNSIIDIGCDHAFLDIYLTRNKHIHCTAVDISPKVIEIAKQNVSKYGLEDSIEMVLSDGLDKIHVKPGDTIVIAGMGTSTILDILSKLTVPVPCILLSNNDHELLRKKMVSKGYYIKEERVIFERGIYYVIIKFHKGFKFYSPMKLRFGPYAIFNNEYVQYLLDKFEKIEKQIPKNRRYKKYQIRKNIRYLNRKKRI